jgi:Asp-tRNA(Asn)/Glu-tRNA(Gln) amidotransferase A subunit family amidase
MADLIETRRRFMAHFAGIGLGSTLAPGILWARMQDAGTTTITLEMVTDALKLSGIELSEEDRKAMVESANSNLTRVEELRKIEIPSDISPPFHFSPVVPGIEVNRTRLPFRLGPAPGIKRPANLEDAAFWPVRHLAELIRTRQVTSLELTEMYLARLHRYNPTLNNVVTFLDDYGRAEARRADAEIAAGKYKGPLHGIPWGAKDIISVKGYTTTWGAAPFKDQVLDYDASVVEMLRDAGAVLIAKLATGELAAGDNWFGGQTKSPWDPSQGSSGSSAGPGSATAAGCVGFAIGTETSGSILSPSARCGLAGLRPTFGRISRYGVMALSWTMDRLGPMCRYAEDCAIVMQAIAKPDGRDMSVSDLPFNYSAPVDVRALRVGYIKESFDDITNPTVKANAAAVLDLLRKVGVARFAPLTIPESTTNTSAINVESSVFFDRFQREGRMKGTRSARPTGRLVSAVDYLQSQRVRTLMMIELAKATAGLDVWVVASNQMGGGRPGGAAGTPSAGGAAGSGPGGGGPGGGNNRPQGPGQRHSTMANLACYPAINVPNGFNETGSPTNVTFFARPYHEGPLIALAKAYQDAAGFHLRRPTKLDAAATAG